MVGDPSGRQDTLETLDVIDQRIIINNNINHDHFSPIGCCLKFSHLIGSEGGFKFDGRKFQRL